MLFLDPPVRTGAIEMVEAFFIDSNHQLIDAVLRRFDSVWRAKVLDGELPARDDIDPAEVADLLPHIMLADIVEEDAGIVVELRLVGQHHLALSGTMPDRTVLSAGTEEGAFAYVALEEIIERGQPAYSMLRVRCSGTDNFEAARAVYPLSSDGKHVDRIVSVVVPYYPAAKGPIEALARG